VGEGFIETSEEKFVVVFVQTLQDWRNAKCSLDKIGFHSDLRAIRVSLDARCENRFRFRSCRSPLNTGNHVTQPTTCNTRQYRHKAPPISLVQCRVFLWPILYSGGKQRQPTTGFITNVGWLPRNRDPVVYLDFMTRSGWS